MLQPRPPKLKETLRYYIRTFTRLVWQILWWFFDHLEPLAIWTGMGIFTTIVCLHLAPMKFPPIDYLGCHVPLNSSEDTNQEMRLIYILSWLDILLMLRFLSWLAIMLRLLHGACPVLLRGPLVLKVAFIIGWVLLGSALYTDLMSLRITKVLFTYFANLE